MDPIFEKKGNGVARKILAPALLILTAAVYVASVNPYWKPEWDSAYFLTLARSMLDGKGFTYLGYPCLKVPFGFPLFIGPLLWLFGPDFLVFNIVMAGIALLSLWVLYQYFAGLFSKEYAAVITFLTGTSYLVMYYSGYIMSDTPYFLFSLMALCFADRFLDRQSNALPCGIAAALCLLACYFIRTIAVSLIGAIAIATLLRRPNLARFRQLTLLSLLILIPISAWTIWSKTQHIDHEDPVWQLAEFVTSKDTFLRERYDQPASRINGAADLARRGIKNGAYYAGNAAMTIVAKRIEAGASELGTVPKAVLLLLGGAVFIMVLGCVLSLIRGENTWVFYVVFYLGILLSWPAREARYLLPIVPFLFHYFVTGLASLTARMQAFLIPRFPSARHFSLTLLACYCSYLGFSNLGDDWGIIRSQHASPYYSSEMRQLMDAIQWVQEHTEKDARIVSVNAPVVAFFGQRWCISFPWVDDPFVILRMFKKVGARYVIISPQLHNEEKYLTPILRDNPSVFHQRYAKGETSVFEVEDQALQRVLSELATPRRSPALNTDARPGKSK